jgi:predicted phage terminase large subunit-like protein
MNLTNKQYIEALLETDLSDYKNLKNLFNMLQIYEKEDFKHAHSLNKIVKKYSAKGSLGKENIALFYQLYKESYLFDAPYEFESYLMYVEWDREPSKRFYLPRRKQLKQVVDALQLLEDDELDLLAISMPPGVGKAQPLYSKLVTPDGYKTMGEIKVGDLVATIDGSFTKVLGIFPQGKKDVYRVTFNDGSYTDCCKEHLWTVKTCDDRRRGGERTIELQQIMRNLRVRGDKRSNYSVEFCKPVEFSKKNLPLHPYLLGCILGDGSISGDNLGFTNCDEDILERFKGLLPDNEILVNKSNHDYRIRKRDDIRDYRGYMVKTITALELEKLGLIGKRSWEKHIPTIYLNSSVEDRIELLRGLMDTDGYVNKNGSCSYATTSKQLVDDFVYLVQSLGGTTFVSSGMNHYKDKTGEFKETRIGYNITVSFTNGINPFYCKRKADRVKTKKRDLKRYITSVEKIGEEECQCIYVDHPSHLYLTDNFIVTHNTTIGCFFLSWIMGRHPDECNLASAHGDKLTRGFYDQVYVIITDPEYNYKDVFPNVVLESVNSKDQFINLNKPKRYKTLTCRSIDGTITGATRCERYLYCDDLVSGIEEAWNRDRLDKLWEKYTNDLKSRKKKRCKEIHIATRWSVHDVIGRLERIYEGNPRAKFIVMPALDENGESNFDYLYDVGFSTANYIDIRNSMDDISWRSLYMNEPIERDGLLFPEDSLNYYNGVLPGKPDRVVFFCDVAWGGGDYLSMPFGYIYGKDIYIPDVVFHKGTKDVTRPIVVGKILKHKPHAGRFEANNGGDEYADWVDEILRKQYNYKMNITHRKAPTTKSKLARIIQAQPEISKCYFLDKKHRSAEYNEFMKNITGFSVSAKNKNDDGPDSMAGLVNFVEKSTTNVTVIPRPF